MKKQIDEILKDLYLIDAGFMNHEQELRKIIANLLESKPDTKFDKKFALKLRSQLLNNNILSKREEFSFATNIINYMKKTYLVAGLVVVLILLIIPVLYYAGQKSNQAAVNKKNVATGINVKKIASRAFGSLASNNQQSPVNDSMVAESSPSESDGAEIGSNFSAPSIARSQSGGGGDMAIGLGGGGGGVAVGEKMMFAPEMYSYRFVYKGEDFELTEKEMEVLKRVKGFATNNELVSMVQGMSLGSIDLGSFNNAKLQNITVSEDRDFGYSVYVDFIEGMINVNENWLKWRQPMQDCRDDQCFQSFRIKESDIPADEEIVRIADDFLRKYGIPTDIYGQGKVDNNWRYYYNQMENKADYYLPEMMTVVYPLLIDGKVVYDEGGMESGLRVSVNIRQKLVSNAYGLSSRQYESSMYETETNFKNILVFAERGGWNRRYNYYMPEESKTLDIEIGTPEITYVNMWRYNGMESNEIIVPALVFPVLNVPDGAWVYEKNIVVPLAVDLLNEARDQYPYPYPILMKGEEGVVTSETVEGVETSLPVLPEVKDINN